MGKILASFLSSFLLQREDFNGENMKHVEAQCSTFLLNMLLKKNTKSSYKDKED
jgi:hypothetical protein